MKFVKQSQTLDFEKICPDFETKTKRHGSLLPNIVRCIVCGPSNCGKTNVIIGLLLHKHGLRFNKVYIYSKTLYQPKYTYLERVFNLIPNISLEKYDSNDHILSPHDAQPNSVIIFDDVVCENQNNIRDYFAMGRHKLIDCFYLSQTYSKIPKQLIRDNTNLLIVFKQDDVNLRHIYDEHVSSDMSWAQFRQMCTEIWIEPYNFMVINKDCPKNKGCYRKKFDTFVLLDE